MMARLARKEVQISTSNFSAEFGRVASGLVNLTSRSGTNAFHGSGYEYLTNEDLGAGQPLTTSGNGHLVRPINRRQREPGNWWIPFKRNSVWSRIRED